MANQFEVKNPIKSAGINMPVADGNSGEVLVTDGNGNLSFFGLSAIGLTYYETGWINRSDWSNVHLGSNTTKNVDSNVNHNLNTPLTSLLVKLFISETGLDSDAFEVSIKDGADFANLGVSYFAIDNNNITVQTATGGIAYVNELGIQSVMDTVNWYYKIVVYKMK